MDMSGWMRRCTGITMLGRIIVNNKVKSYKQFGELSKCDDFLVLIYETKGESCIRAMCQPVRDMRSTSTGRQVGRYLPSHSYSVLSYHMEIFTTMASHLKNL